MNLQQYLNQVTYKTHFPSPRVNVYFFQTFLSRGSCCLYTLISHNFITIYKVYKVILSGEVHNSDWTTPKLRVLWGVPPFVCSG